MRWLDNYPGYKHGVRYGYKERNMNVAISPVDDEHVKVSVRGSLHKYFNGGKHNANDFTPGMVRLPCVICSGFYG